MERKDSEFTRKVGGNDLRKRRSEKTPNSQEKLGGNDLREFGRTGGGVTSVNGAKRLRIHKKSWGEMIFVNLEDQAGG